MSLILFLFFELANRAVVSNRLSTSGNSWVENFSRYHSGTYANQWMVLDFNKYASLFCMCICSAYYSVVYIVS